ncbi:hypothetical protein F1643_01010 [Azospirillum sp. INR13]|nr:hypothetical protein [Azospirillum sp. INR13]
MAASRNQAGNSSGLGTDTANVGCTSAMTMCSVREYVRMPALTRRSLGRSLKELQDRPYRQNGMAPVATGCRTRETSAKSPHRAHPPDLPQGSRPQGSRPQGSRPQGNRPGGCGRGYPYLVPNMRSPASPRPGTM